MILAINPSHDASVAWFNENGKVIHAISEERLTRKKNDFIFPRASLAWLSKQEDLSETTVVIISGISSVKSINFEILGWMFRKESYIGFDGQRHYRFPPGLPKFYGKKNSWDVFQELILKELALFNINAKLVFENHHECHAWSAIVPSGYSEGLALTLDGEGDLESGSFWKFARHENGYSVQKLKSFPVKDSLGYFYSAITGRYNMKRYSHEGKITGLAAHGREGTAYKYLKDNVRCVNGAPYIQIPNSKLLKGLSYIASQTGFHHRFPYNHTALADVAAKESESFADLAYAAQRVLEEVVIALLGHARSCYGAQDLVLAGGVFSNVKLNQVLAESGLVERVYVYPNMGDGGLPIGGGYKFLSEQQLLPNTSSFEFDPYVGSSLNPYDSGMQNDSRFTLEAFCEDDWIARVVELLTKNYSLGLIQGRMEFGPRALMNRSIIASATDVNINRILNKRLRRTEYMPFAPVVRVENLTKVFDVSKIKDLRSFNSMTMTCSVRSEYLNQIPAVVHVDGTARPQVVSKDSNALAWRILKHYEEKTGIPCIINTSFNAHEEPIVESSVDIATSLLTNAVDYVIFPYSVVRTK